MLMVTVRGGATPPRESFALNLRDTAVVSTITMDLADVNPLHPLNARSHKITNIITDAPFSVTFPNVENVIHILFAYNAK